MVRLYEEEMRDRFREVTDFIELRNLYQKICDILGSETEMEALNSLFKQRFIIAPTMAIFLQGATNQLLFNLLQRDPETSKQVFQLVIDSELNPG